MDSHPLIVTFRGLNPRNLEGTNTCIKPLNTLLKQILKKTEREEVHAAQSILDHWQKILGPIFSRECQLKRITPDGKMWINCTNATLAREVYFKKGEILGRLRQQCPQTRVNDIRTMQG